MTINPNIPTIPDPITDLTALAFCVKQIKIGMDIFAGRSSQQLPYSRAATMQDVVTAVANEANARAIADKADAQKVTFLIGDGTTTSFNLKHNIGRVNNVTQVYNAASPFDLVDQFIFTFAFDPGTEGDPSVPTAGTLPSSAAALTKQYNIYNVDDNTVNVSFLTAPTPNQYRVNVVG